jgi:hypothetical protein
MTTREISPQPPGTVGPSYDEWRDRRWRLTVLAFVALWLMTATAVGLAGEKRSDLGRLEAGLSDGSASRVEILGLPEDPDWRGRTTVTLEWRGAWLHRFAEVQVDHRRRPGTSDDGARIVGDPATYLRSLDPDLEIGYGDLTGYQEWRGWRGPGWALLLGVATWFGTVLLAGSGPEPWRATRWAWTWLTLFGGPLGCLGFFLLGGPLGVARPRNPHRRLTGGWAFLLSLVFLGGASTS